MGRKRTSNVLGSIVWPKNEYWNKMKWIVYVAKEYPTGKPVVQIKNEGGNTFTWPGLSKNKAKQLVSILNKFINQ